MEEMRLEPQILRQAQDETHRRSKKEGNHVLLASRTRMSTDKRNEKKYSHRGAEGSGECVQLWLSRALQAMA